MRAIYLDSHYGHLHPCEVDSLKFNPLTNKYVLYYFDRTLGDYMYAYLKKVDDRFYIVKNDYSSEENPALAFASLALQKLDITHLPPYITMIDKPSIENKTISKNKGYIGYVFKQKIDFLEIESYEDALNGVKYYYFIIQEMLPRINGFKYLAYYSCVSNKPLKKNIIARHKLSRPIEDVPHEYGMYSFEFGLEDNLNINMKIEALLAKRIMELNKGKRENMDPVLLTKIVRMILHSKDRDRAALEYETLLSKYYDKWLEERVEKHI